MMCGKSVASAFMFRVSLLRRRLKCHLIGKDVDEIVRFFNYVPTCWLSLDVSVAIALIEGIRSSVDVGKDVLTFGRGPVMTPCTDVVKKA